MFWGLAGFLITIGILVTIHEWGHFWVARQFDVKILRFSLGFGKPFYTWKGKKDGTLYTLAPIPLGGFVQMLGETAGEDVPAAEKSRTFQAKPAWQRFLIAFAGPAINLIFAVLAFAGLYLYGVEGLRPEVAYVAPNSVAAAAGFQRGDILKEIDGKEVKLSNDAHVVLIKSGSEQQNIPISITRDGVEKNLLLDLSGFQKGDELYLSKVTGLYLVDEWLPAVIEKTLPDSAAEKMGLQAGDKIIALNDNQATDIIQIGEILKTQAPESKITLGIERNGKHLTIAGRLGEREANGKKVAFLGVQWQPINLSAARTVERYNLWDSLGHGWDKMVYYIRLTYDMFGKMLTGKASLDNVGGPITIGDAAGKTLRYGADVFINFLGLISLSLAAINLLPIPMLDGGHMLFYALEMIRGKPLSEQVMQWSFRIGAGLVYVFMGFVVFKDIFKYLL